MTDTLSLNGFRLIDGLEVATVVLVENPEGIDLFSTKAEQEILPIVGPTGFLLARHLIARCAGLTVPVDVPLESVGRALGVNPETLYRTIKRLHLRGVIVHRERIGQIDVRDAWAPRPRNKR